MTNKVFDAVVLIDIIAECHFPALLRAWSMNPRYELWIPAEINREVLGIARKDLDVLINDKIVKIFPDVDNSKLIAIQRRKPTLSLNDCSIYYHCINMPDAIALTNDRRLRTFLESGNLTFHGTKAIYEKIIKEMTFSIQEIEQRFAKLKQDPRTFPP